LLPHHAYRFRGSKGSQPSAPPRRSRCGAVGGFSDSACGHCRESKQSEFHATGMEDTRTGQDWIASQDLKLDGCSAWGLSIPAVRGCRNDVHVTALHRRAHLTRWVFTPPSLLLAPYGVVSCARMDWALLAENGAYCQPCFAFAMQQSEVRRGPSTSLLS
jgi:hypothetical protein